MCLDKRGHYILPIIDIQVKMCYHLLRGDACVYS